MTDFEKMIIGLGYEKFIYNCTTHNLEKAKKHFISSLVNLDHRYIHPEYPENEIVFGLSEAGKPPTLKSPRPKIIGEKEICFNDGSKRIIRSNVSHLDDGMNKALQKYKPEEIYKAIQENKTLNV